MKVNTRQSCGLVLLTVAVVINIVQCSEAVLEQPKSGSSTKNKCENSYTTMCLKLDIINLMDKISTTNSEYNLATGVSLVKEVNTNRTHNAKVIAELARQFPESPEKRLNGFLIARLSDFIQSYSLKFKLLNDVPSEDVESRKGGGGYGGKKDKGGMGLIGMAMMMKGTMMAMALAGLAALAGKALLAGMVALTLSAIVGLKSLTSKDDKKTTYEIISKPVYSHSHSHSASGGHGGSHEDHGHSGGGGGQHSAYSGYGRSMDFQLPASVKA
ncbi:unnamed protein product [Diamesa hyperborea]